MEKRINRIEPAPPAVRKKRVAAYARVSSGKDAMLHSLSAQVSYYSNLIQRHIDWEYKGVYADTAITGTKAERPEFQRLVTDCREGKIDMVITKSISRFARNTVTMLETVRELRALGVSVYFEEQRIDSLSGNGELLLSIYASCAQEESRATSENGKWRIRKSFQKGEPMNWQFMYGYRIKKHTIRIEENEAAVVRRIFNDYIGGVGISAISRALREEAVPSYRGGIWSPKRVLDVVCNEKYAGNALLQKKYVVDHLNKRLVANHGVLPQYYAEGTHPAIVTQEVFDQATARRAANHQKNGGSHATPKAYPFTSLLICDDCGKYFHRKMNNGKPCWICGTYLTYGKDACASQYIPESILEKMVASALGQEHYDPQSLIQVKEIHVPAFHKLVFVFTDGTSVAAEWQTPSRRESWTPEMRAKAAGYARKGRTK